MRLKGQIKSVVISRQADRWFAAINVETQQLQHSRKANKSVGIDLGIKSLATLSTGASDEGPKAHTALLKRLRRTSRRLSKKEKGSRNARKAKTKLARLHARISNIRRDHLHKLTTELVLNNRHIGIEDLNVKGMAANRRLSRHIMDQSFYEFRRQLTYKSEWYGSELVVVDRFYPSSKRCHHCGWIKEDLQLADRQWTCVCGEDHDRDINAAKNIAAWMHEHLHTVSSTGIYACGTESAGLATDCSQAKLCRAEAGSQR